MDMHMIGVMYAPGDKLTLMLMQDIVTNNMDLRARMMMMNGMTMFREFSTTGSGLGDMRITALIGISDNGKTSFHLNTGLNIPIGDIEERDDTPMMQNAKLPYAMQLGSGTWDLCLGGTFKQSFYRSSWGSQLKGIIRTGDNSEGYRFGNQYILNVWGAYRILDNISISCRLAGSAVEEISGMDDDLNPMMITTASTDNYGGTFLRSFIGTNIVFGNSSIFRDLRLGIEAGLPVYEDYNGIQMNENLNLQVGAKYTIL